jgi:segregation and condensation protein A
MIEFKIQNYNRPLAIDKILELIEEKQLEISEINLALIVEDFLNYWKSLEKMDITDLADFIYSASCLLLIKSKSLLPEANLSQEEEAEIKEFQDRIIFFKEFKIAKSNIAKLFGENRLFSRNYLNVLNNGKFFYPSTNLTIENLSQEINKLFDDLKINFQESIQKEILTLESKINEVLERLSKVKEDSFVSLSKDKTKLEAIVLFLALLHLAKDKIIVLEQNELFSNIIIKPQNQP